MFYYFYYKRSVNKSLYFINFIPWNFREGQQILNMKKTNW